MKLLLGILIFFISTGAWAFPLRFDWDAVTTMEDGTPITAVAYRVYKRNAYPETSTWFYVSQTIYTHYSASQLQFGKFVYRVTAVHEGVESNPSNEVKIAIELNAKEVQ